MATVICAGTVTVDLVFDVAAFPAEGVKVRAAASRMVAGGGALYAAAAVAGLGGHAILAGAVGDDPLGEVVRRSLAALGIDGGLLATVPGAATARSAVLVSPGGERTIVNHRDDRLFGAAPAALPGSFDAVLADTRWPAGAAALVRAARRAGRPAVLDAEAPVLHAAAALSGASHVAFSEQGLADLEPGPADRALRAAAARLGAWTCVTRGGAPVLCCAEGALFEVAAFPAEAVDTLGAGDVWHGAFALGLAEGRAETEAVRRANAAAAIKVARRGGAPMPKAAEVDALMAGGR